MDLLLSELAKVCRNGFFCEGCAIEPFLKPCLFGSYFFVLLSRPSVMEIDSDGSAFDLSITSSLQAPAVHYDYNRRCFLNSHCCLTAYAFMFRTLVR